MPIQDIDFDLYDGLDANGKRGVVRQFIQDLKDVRNELQLDPNDPLMSSLFPKTGNGKLPNIIDTWSTQIQQGPLAAGNSSAEDVVANMKLRQIAEGWWPSMDKLHKVHQSIAEDISAELVECEKRLEIVKELAKRIKEDWVYFDDKERQELLKSLDPYYLELKAHLNYLRPLQKQQIEQQKKLSAVTGALRNILELPLSAKSILGFSGYQETRTAIVLSADNPQASIDEKLKKLEKSAGNHGAMDSHASMSHIECRAGTATSYLVHCRYGHQKNGSNNGAHIEFTGEAERQNETLVRLKIVEIPSTIEARAEQAVHLAFKMLANCDLNAKGQPLQTIIVSGEQAPSLARALKSFGVDESKIHMVPNTGIPKVPLRESSNPEIKKIHNKAQAMKKRLEAARALRIGVGMQDLESLNKDSVKVLGGFFNEHDEKINELGVEPGSMPEPVASPVIPDDPNAGDSHPGSSREDDDNEPLDEDEDEDQPSSHLGPK